MKKEKKVLNKTQKIQLVFISIVLVILISFLGYTIYSTIHEIYIKTQESKNIVEKFNSLYESDQAEILLFASPSCKYCRQFKPVLEELEEIYNFKYSYIDVGSVFDKDLKEIKSKLNIEITGIPHLIVVKNKKVVGEQSGAKTKENTIEFLKKTEIIKGEE